MKTNIENHLLGYDTRLETSDWRYSGSVIGLIKYFDFLGRKTGKEFYKQEEEGILYFSGDITEERYLEFAEDYFADEMHHKKVEEWLLKEDFTDEDIKSINERLAGSMSNTVMKNIFSKNKFNGSNKDEILKLIEQNRKIIIKETFRNKKNLYANYGNTNLFLNFEKLPHCRLVNYNVDEGRKSKSLAYQFDTETFVNEDCIEFDFIPFAFTNTREALFINNNFTVKQLLQTHQKLNGIIKNEMDQEKGNAKAALFGAIIESADFIDFDVEVIIKNREYAFYETMFIRKDAIKILRCLKDKKAAFSFAYKRGENDYINIQNEVVHHILNNILLDDLIEMFLKEKDRNYHYLIDRFIEINLKIKGGMDMTGDMKSAFACAKEVVKVFIERKQENKIDTYRQKLISAVVFHDYDRTCEILLQLSNYSGVSFSFAYPLFEDFESHKELAYTFINALEKNSDKKGKGDNE